MEIAKRPENEMVVGYKEDQGAGFENQSDQDLVLPFISILQALSKQVQRDTKLPGAEPGKIFNTVTEEMADEISFVPAHVEHAYVEWIPRKRGGGFVARHQADSDVVKEAIKASTKFGKYTHNDNDLVETFYVSGVVYREDGRCEPAVIAFSSTKITVYKKWMTRLRMFILSSKDGKVRPPLFAHATKIKTISQHNAEGDFYNFLITPASGDIKESLLSPDDARFQAARDLRQMVIGGKAKIAEETQDSPAEATTEVF